MAPVLDRFAAAMERPLQLRVLVEAFADLIGAGGGNFFCSNFFCSGFFGGDFFGGDFLNIQIGLQAVLRLRTTVLHSVHAHPAPAHAMLAHCRIIEPLHLARSVAPIQVRKPGAHDVEEAGVTSEEPCRVLRVGLGYSGSAGDFGLAAAIQGEGGGGDAEDEEEKEADVGDDRDVSWRSGC